MSMKASHGDGLIDIPSNHSVDETVEKLKGVLQAKGVTLFALVDHSGEAAKVGMKMRPTKFLIWEDAQGKFLVTYNSPAYLQKRHHVPAELLQNVVVVEALAKAAAE